MKLYEYAWGIYQHKERVGGSLNNYIEEGNFMKHKEKRVLSALLFLLCLVMLCLPMKVYASEITSKEQAEEIVAEQESIISDAEAKMEEANHYLVEKEVPMYATFWALVPPIVAIVLALLTKEVYFSLFLGIVAGCLFYANFNIEKMMDALFVNGIIAQIADSYHVGILIFLVILGIMVSLMNKVGGSAAYGRWAGGKISSKRGALLSTFSLGALIFVDDYFNCLTVGSVMRPVTDKHKISRAKLAYIIDATAAPICIIAPISSWAAAVTSSIDVDDGFSIFVKAIFYNYYALLTIAMIIIMAFLKFDFGPMAKHERNAEKGDLFTTTDRPYAEDKEEKEKKGKVIDLVLPVIALVISSVCGMIYTGGFFHGEANLIEAFANCDASVGLVYGSFIALVITFFIYIPRRVISFREFAESFVDGFKAMVPAILILIFAWTLGGITKRLGANQFVETIVSGSAEGFKMFLPSIIFLIATGLAFATGTSWGTFGILLPIVVAVVTPGSEMMIISISSCLAGAVCGDHISPISDTTIMASTGAQCNHINHVTTQLPYALLVAAVSCVCYILAAFIQNKWIMLPIAFALLFVVLLVIKSVTQKQQKGSVNS